mgnify:FL=1
MNNKLFTIQEVANILGVSTKTLRRWDQRGSFVATRTVGNQRRYTREQIEEFKSNRGPVSRFPPASAPSSILMNDEVRAVGSPSSPATPLFDLDVTPKPPKANHALPSVLSGLPSGSFLRNHFLLKYKARYDTESGKDETVSSYESQEGKEESRNAGDPSLSSGLKPVNPFKMGFMFTILVLVFSFAGTGVLTKYNVIAGLNAKKDQFAKFIANLPEISFQIKPRTLSFVPQENYQSVLAASTGDSGLILNVNIPAVFAESATFLKTAGIGTNTPDASAVLDLTSEDKGFLAPRMTTSQRDAIASPATGLFVFNTITNQYNMYNGKSWGSIGAVTAIGDAVTAGDTATGEAFTEKGTSGTSLWFNATDGGKAKVTAGSISGTKILTLPNATGTFITTGNLSSITTVGTIATGVWN